MHFEADEHVQHIRGDVILHLLDFLLVSSFSLEVLRGLLNCFQEVIKIALQFRNSLSVLLGFSLELLAHVDSKLDELGGFFQLMEGRRTPISFDLSNGRFDAFSDNLLDFL